MATDKESDSPLFQQGLASTASRTRGVKNVLGGNRKAAESTQRKPLGSDQNICTSSANEDKAKMQKQKPESPESLESPESFVKDVDLQPDGFGQSIGSVSISAIFPSAEYDDIGLMDLEFDADDDLTDLLHWHPCELSSPDRECCVWPLTPLVSDTESEVQIEELSPLALPDWKSMCAKFEEEMEEPLIPVYFFDTDF